MNFLRVGEILTILKALPDATIVESDYGMRINYGTQVKILRPPEVAFAVVAPKYVDGVMTSFGSIIYTLPISSDYNDGVHIFNVIKVGSNADWFETIGSTSVYIQKTAPSMIEV